MRKIISLTRGFEAVVDDEDYDRLVAIGNWCAANRGNKTYAIHSGKRNGKWTTIGMHRVVLEADKGIDIDHINGNALDNQKTNLRLCTNSENQMNRGADRGSRSQFKGIYWNKKAGKWHGHIMANGHRTFLGHFDDEIDAAKAYDEAARELHGDFARLNFSENL